MARFIKCLLLLVMAAPLSACGIKGNLKTPPPIWSDNVDQSAEASEGTDEAEEDLLDDEEEDVGYGIDVADTP